MSYGVEQTKFDLVPGQAAGHQVNTGEVGLFDRVIDGVLLAVDIGDHRVRFGEGVIRDVAEATGRRGLGIAIDDQDTVATDGKVLGKVDGADRLGYTAFEALHGEHLARLAVLAARGGAEDVAQFVDLIQCVATDPTRVGVLHRDYGSVGILFLAGEGGTGSADHGLSLGDGKFALDVLLHLG